jgi:hypothetical protein
LEFTRLKSPIGVLQLNGANATAALFLFICLAHKEAFANATRDVKAGKVRTKSE